MEYIYSCLIDQSPYHSIEPKLLSIHQVYSVLFSIYLNVSNRWNTQKLTPEDLSGILAATPERLDSRVFVGLGLLDPKYYIPDWRDGDEDDEE